MLITHTTVKGSPSSPVELPASLDLAATLAAVSEQCPHVSRADVVAVLDALFRIHKRPQ